jgi:hypothetical protein
MRVDEARAMVLDLMSADLRLSGSSVQLSDAVADMRDHGQFLLDGKPARVIHHWSGWHPTINRSWFSGSFDRPRVWGSDFYWYVFAVPRLTRRRLRDHYFVCDYLQMREWVRSFAAPLGNDHQDHSDWRADVRVFEDDGTEQTGYFRWGDEPVGSTPLATRVISLDNVTTIGDVALVGLHVGLYGLGGESADHKHLKLYVAAHPTEFGMSAAARSTVEYGFRTGDRVDVMFENHAPDRTVVEIEIEGEENVCVGIHQAVKYRSLAEVDGGYPLQGANVRSLVVAYHAEYPKTIQLARRYDVSLQSVGRQHVLASAV